MKACASFDSFRFYRICLQHTAAEVVSVRRVTGFGGMLPEGDSGYIHPESLEIFSG
jgi:hypothetical protein